MLTEYLIFSTFVLSHLLAIKWHFEYPLHHSEILEDNPSEYVIVSYTYYLKYKWLDTNILQCVR